MNAESVLFALLRAAVCGEQVSEEVKTECTAQMLEEVCALAARHDLAHLVGHAASSLSLVSCPALEKSKRLAMFSVFRYAKLEREYERICAALETAEIAFIPLKGSVLRKYYPEPWMRTSCDIDVLVHEEDLDAAAAVLEKELNYRTGEKGGHDLSLHAESGVHIELHYSMLEEAQVVGSHRVLERFWEESSPCEGKRFHREVSDAMFYFYHIAHMAKHVEVGGCGIRTLLDQWILRHRVEHDAAKRSALLDEGGLAKFEAAACALSELWFSAAPANPVLTQFERFILDGGAYGTIKSCIAMQQQKTGGTLGYAASKMFLSYDALKLQYPVLEGRRYLTPLLQLRRWGRLIFCGGLKRSVRELQINADVSQEEKSEAEQLLGYLGLEN